MPITPEEDAQDINSAMPGTPPPEVTGKRRSRLSIGLILTLVALVVVVAAYLIMTAIPNGGGSP